jgi:hypothetical protein
MVKLLWLSDHSRQSTVRRIFNLYPYLLSFVFCPWSCYLILATCYLLPVYWPLFTVWRSMFNTSFSVEEKKGSSGPVASWVFR